MGLAYALVPFWIWQGILPARSVLVWLSLPWAWRSARLVLTQRGRPLNAALAGTGMCALIYSLLFLIGVMV
jgi:1,4-dihydroxy-2-naphthoate octaprenyltransferase